MFAERIVKAFEGATPTAPSAGPLAGSVRTAISTITGQEFFGPQQPMYPVAPSGTQTRQWDYPYAWNLLYRPRSEQQGPSFDQLRLIAYSYDLVRSCVETRKDQVAKFPFDFHAKQMQGETKKEQAKRTLSSKTIPILRELFECPDGKNDFQGWLRMLLEDVLVIDALTIDVQRQNRQDVPETRKQFKTGDSTRRRAQSGKVVRLVPIDGATIKPLIDAQGLTPLYPNPSYQQNIKGMPAINLTTQDILYRPRNPRTNSGYGYSPVEQCLMAVNIGLRREASQLHYYTSGNVPEALIAAPESWSMDQIAQMQAYFDQMEGDLAARRKVRWIPATKSVTMTKEAMLKDEFDEWLARIICYIFSLPPTPFVKQMNRAVAAQVQQTALQEGLLPMLNWMAGVFNWIIHNYMGFDDVEFAWTDEQEPDALKQAQIDKIYASYGKQSVDEQRERDGQDPIGMGNAILQAAGPPIMLAEFLKSESNSPEAYSLPKVPDPATLAAGPGQRALPPGKGGKKPAGDPAHTMFDPEKPKQIAAGEKEMTDAKDSKEPKRKLPKVAAKYLDRINGHPRYIY